MKSNNIANNSKDSWRQYIAILAGAVNFLPHPNPPLIKGRE
jgi:hypothetical protein